MMEASTAPAKGQKGRPKGSPNKASVQRQKAIESSGLTPLGYMLQVLRNEKEPNERRMWAAKTAARYVHPALAQVEWKGDTGPIAPAVMQFAALLESLNDDERSVIRGLLARAAQRSASEPEGTGQD